MLKKIVCIMGAVAIFILAVGCSSEPQKPKLGVSFGCLLYTSDAADD